MGKPKTNDPPEGKREASGNLEGDLALEVKHTRQVLREITQHVACKLESETVRLLEMAVEIPEGEEKQEALESALESMRKMKVRPQKGKLGDLRRIRNAVKEAGRRLEELL